MIPLVSSIMGFPPDDPNVTRRAVSESYVKRSLKKSGKKIRDSDADSKDKNIEGDD